MRSVFVLLFFFITFFSIGQFGFEFNDNLPVVVSGENLKDPWAGGINYAQFSDFDYDYDGDLDLFVFDRSSNNIRVYTQEGTGSNKHYKLAYNAALKFPPGIRYRATMVDFDMDGKKDLFTYGIGGLSVYRNVGNATDGLQWELFSDLIYSQYPNGYSNLYVSSSDIPALVDVDFDGDIDILTFHISGQHLEYHQNQSMELYGIPDSLVFELKNECWGKFTEDLNTNSVLLNDPNSPCVNGNIPNPERLSQPSKKHAGSTVLAFDYDNSGVMDLLLGDVSYANVSLLINGGSTPNTDSPMISFEPAFPSNSNAINMTLFPATFFLDVDFDGVKDLIVCPNARNVSRNKKSVLFYKNIGTNELPTFVYTQDDFLQNEMIDHGTASVPIFSDINEDGLEDLIIANFYKYKEPLDKESTFAYYQNTGTLSAPEFTLIDENYLDLNTKNYGLRSIPTFGDVDGDGDKDLFIGTENGTLVFYQNTSTGTGSIYTNGITNYTDNTGQVINVNSFCHPQLFDIDNDGLLDLIIGKKTGEIVYYRNIGTVNSPSFQLINSNLGGIDVSTANPDGYASPHFFRLNGNLHLFLGDLEGRFNYYSNIEGNLNSGQTFDLISDNYININTQAYSSFAVNDINNDGNLELYVGQDLGGVYRFENDPNSTASVNSHSYNASIKLYPNPVVNKLHIHCEQQRIKFYSIHSVEGHTVAKVRVKTSIASVNAENLAKGVYLIYIELEDGEKQTKRFVKH